MVSRRWRHGRARSFCAGAQKQRRYEMLAAQVAIPPGRGALAMASTLILALDNLSSEPANILPLPRLLHELSAIQRHVLGRVAAHGWTQGGAIPYIPPNAHQRDVARALADAPFRLVVASRVAQRRASFRLTHLGELAARRLLPVVLTDTDRARECEFDRLRWLMRNEWETCDEPKTNPDSRPRVDPPCLLALL